MPGVPHAVGMSYLPDVAIGVMLWSFVLVVLSAGGAVAMALLARRALQERSSTPRRR